MSRENSTGAFTNGLGQGDLCGAQAWALSRLTGVDFAPVSANHRQESLRTIVNRIKRMGGDVVAAASGGGALSLIAAIELTRERLGEGEAPPKLILFSSRLAVGDYAADSPYYFPRSAHMLEPRDPRRAQAFYDAVPMAEKLFASLDPEERAALDITTFGPAKDSVVDPKTMCLPGVTHIQVSSLSLGPADHVVGIAAGFVQARNIV